MASTIYVPAVNFSGEPVNQIIKEVFNKNNLKAHDAHGRIIARGNRYEGIEAKA